jgi:hypothetical protein
MLASRRKKQTIKKRLATTAKQQKKLRKENVDATATDALKKRST